MKAAYRLCPCVHINLIQQKFKFITWLNLNFFPTAKIFIFDLSILCISFLLFYAVFGKKFKLQQVPKSPRSPRNLAKSPKTKKKSTKSKKRKRKSRSNGIEEEGNSDTTLLSLKAKK